MKYRRTAGLVAAGAFAASSAALLAIAPPSIAAGPPIEVGAILTITGAGAQLGESERNGLTLLERDVNAHGGVHGRQVHFEVEDDENKPDVAAQLATAAVARGDVAIVCGTRTASAFAVARAPAASGTPIVYMTPSATVWDTRNGVAQNVFQAPPRDDLEASKVVTFARTSLHARTLGLIHDENEYGTNGARVVTNVAKTEGLQVIDDESYPGDGTDFTAQVGRLRAAKPDVVVLWGGTQTPALVTRAVRTLGVTAPLIGSSGILSEGYLHVAAATSEGVYSVTSLNFTHPDERQRRFLAGYHDAFHVRPNAFAAFGWDAANVIVAGLRAGGPSSALAATMQSMPPVEGVDGTYRFSPSDHNGLTASSLHIAVAKNEVWFTQ